MTLSYESSQSEVDLVTGGPAYMLSPSLPLGSPIWTMGELVITVTLVKINFWSEVLPHCILQLLTKKTFSSSRLRLRGFLSYPSSSSTFTTLIAHINSQVASGHLARPRFILS